MRVGVPMSSAVNLLLLLSALLSALTGAGLGARAAQPAVAVSRIAETAVAAQVKPVRAITGPVAALPDLTAVAGARSTPAWLLAPAAPLYLSRRRE